jgi:hypothetical protein
MLPSGAWSGTSAILPADVKLIWCAQARGGKLRPVRHLTRDELAAGLDHITRSPADGGRVELIVRRPQPGEREVLAEGTLHLDDGLVGDCWRVRGSTRTPDGGPHPDKQLNLMNARVAALIAVDPDRRALAGDQLYVDLDLSVDNLPPGTRLALGSAVIEITDQPHRGCGKFSARFGLEALRFVNSDAGQTLRLRGTNARVVVAGTVRVGDLAQKVPPAPPTTVPKNQHASSTLG